jgi:uncharacterized cupredoxin-like copper-binding protein
MSIKLFCKRSSRLVLLTIITLFALLALVACNSGASAGSQVTSTSTGSSSATTASTSSATTASTSSATKASSGGGSGNSSSASKIQVTEKDFSLTLSTNVVTPGQIEFDLTNQGPSEHEFVIFKTNLAPDNLPTKNGIVDESASSLTKVFEQNQYAPNTSKTVNVNLDAGSYVIICNLPGHYLQGMRAGLTVTADAAPTMTALASTADQSGATAKATSQPAESQPTSGNDVQATSVGVIEKNYDIYVDRDSVPTGMVTFNLRNEGVSSHEFVIFKTELPADSLPVNDAQVQEGASNLLKIAEQQEFAPGETRQLSVHLDPGHYVLICNLPDHYQQGMHIDFTVAESNTSASTASSSSATPTATPSSASQTYASGSATKVSVIEENYGIYLNRVTAPAGAVEFDLSNLGPDQHEFVVFKTDLAPDKLPVDQGLVNENASSLQKINEQQEYPSGDSRTLTVNLEPGNYVLICNIVGHYEQGMHVGFTVTSDSGSSDVKPIAEATDTVSVIEKNYGIYLNTSAVPAGQVNFDLSNLGPDQHEFVVFKTDLAADKLPVVNGQVNENASSLVKQDEQQEYPSGETRTLTLNLDPGHYVLICNLPGHYQQGMHVDFTVVGSNSASSASATSSSSATPAATSEATGTLKLGTLSIIEGSFQIFANRSTIPAGQITFDITNTGPDDHELVVFKTDLSINDLPVQNGQVVEDDPALQKIGEQDQFPAGESRSLTLNLDPGHYVLICNLPGHYEQGMRFGLTVTEAHERIDVIEKNYEILLNHSSIKAGTIDFVLQNLGPDDHEFVVFKTDLAPDQLPVENGQVIEDAPGLVKIDEQDQYPPNETRVLTLDLDAGQYVLICNLPGHYEQGMYYLLNVVSD